MSEDKCDDLEHEDPTDPAYWTKQRLDPYMREIVRQAAVADIAVTDYNDWHANGRSGGRGFGDLMAFASLQTLVGAGALVSKLIWPGQRHRGTPSQRALTSARGVAIRAALGVEDIPVLRDKLVRNALEHFDEHLDSVIEDGRALIDSNIGPADMVMIDDEPAVHLRRLDPGEGELEVVDVRVNFHHLAYAIGLAAAMASRWIWDNETPRPWGDRPPRPDLPSGPAPWDDVAEE